MYKLPYLLGVFGFGMAGVYLCYLWVVEELKRRAPPCNWGRRRRMWPSAAVHPNLPDLDDPLAVGSFFREEVRKGEVLLAGGDIEGVNHLAFGVAVLENSSNLLTCYREVLPDEHFTMLYLRIQEIKPYLVDDLAFL